MSYRKLGRTSAQRKAMLRDLTTDLIINERIETTETRAKELRSVVEKMITLGKRGDLHARRQAAAYIRNEVANEENNQDALQKLFSFCQKAKMTQDMEKQRSGWYHLRRISLDF